MKGEGRNLPVGTMLDVCLLGTGGMMPLPKRWLTSLMCRCNGKNILIDCGEGTQLAIKEAGLLFKPIDVICITHFHADHVSGLPGLLLAMGNADRTKELTMIGPKGLKKVVNALRVIAPELPFDIKFVEVNDLEKEIQFEDFRIKAFRVNHRVTCYGYTVEVDRSGKFDVKRAKALDLPVQYWSHLQKGETVKYNDMTYTPDMVMGENRKGIKVCYTTDTRPTQSIIDNAMYADLFICEGMYGEEEKITNAKEHKHMLFFEAANLAKEAEVKEAWLTHFSPALIKPEMFMEETKKIFENIVAGKDGMKKEI